MIPGEIIPKKESIVINENTASKEMQVTNTGDRPIQVGSHFHFFEANRFLKFDREQAYGYRLDIASGTAVRFEAGKTKKVSLIEIAGNRRIKGLNNLTDAQINESTKKASLKNASLKGFE